MIKLRLNTLLLLTPMILSAANVPANASPMTYTGSKGQYTVDYEAGTYNGCLYKQSCLLLGPNQRIGRYSWENGDYTYTIDYSAIVVKQNGKVIFEDSFLNKKSSRRIAEGYYGIGPEFGIKVNGNQYRFMAEEDQDQGNHWRPISELEYVSKGIISAYKNGQKYYGCYTKSPEIPGYNFVCSRHGWVREPNYH